MLDSIKYWFTKSALIKAVAWLLDKLPLNGRKTELGMVVLFLNAIAGGLGNEIAISIFTELSNLLAGYGAELTVAGLTVMVTGLVHKILKWLGVGK